MKSRIVRFACYLGLTVLTGCAAKGEVLGEPQMRRLGMGALLGKSYFDLEGGEAGAVVARVIADYLQHQGWRAVAMEPSQVAGPAFNGQPDVKLSGSVLAFSVHATSTIGSTEIKVATKLNVEAENMADGSIVRMTLNGTGSQTVFWFWYEPEDAQRLISEVWSESISKLVADTRIEGNLLRLK